MPLTAKSIAADLHLQPEEGKQIMKLINQAKKGEIAPEDALKKIDKLAHMHGVEGFVLEGKNVGRG